MFYRNLPRMTQVILDVLIDMLEEMRYERVFVIVEPSLVWRVIE